MNGFSERKCSYPIQTATYLPNTDTLDGTQEEETRNPFPKSVRALKDSKGVDKHGRTVVICLDGTGDRFDGDNSNVVHFVSSLKKDRPNEQVTYYQSGIGTYDKGGLKNGFGAAMDMAVGSGLGVHIIDAYRFLMQTYREGDKICLFGFSRGAYTVRCLAGMLHKVGLLPAHNSAQINFAFDFYKDDTKKGWKMSAQFKKTFCTNVNVYFVGLWDCVASVGFLPRKLPFSKSPTNSIHYFRHAMALDEHRSKFKVCQWQHQDPDIKRRETLDNTPKAQLSRGFSRTGILKLFGMGNVKTVGAETNGHAHTNGYHKEKNGNKKDEKNEVPPGMTEKEAEQARLEALFEKRDRTRQEHHRVHTNALEVWFKGAHADIGGGAVANEKRHMLSRIPLRWMIRQCFECDTGILFDTAALVEEGLDMHTLWPKWKPVVVPPVGPSPDLISRYEEQEFPPIRRRSAFIKLEDDDDDDDDDENTGEEEKKEKKHFHDQCRHAYLPECTEEYFDALAPVNDMLEIAKGWWILEVWPVKIRVLKKDGDGWEKKVRWNLGRHRAVRETVPKMHWTVKRMVEEGKYEIKGRCERAAHWEVVG